MHRRWVHSCWVLFLAGERFAGRRNMGSSVSTTQLLHTRRRHAASRKSIDCRWAPTAWPSGSPIQTLFLCGLDAHELPPPGAYKGAVNGRATKHLANQRPYLASPAITPLPSQRPVHPQSSYTYSRPHIFAGTMSKAATLCISPGPSCVSQVSTFAAHIDLPSPVLRVDSQGRDGS